MQADGRLSQAGQQRIRNAVFAKAYGDSDLVAMLAESTDSNVRNILNGLLRAAPDVARLQDLIAAGARRPMDFAPELVRAVRELDALREQGRSLEASHFNSACRCALSAEGIAPRKRARDGYRISRLRALCVSYAKMSASTPPTTSISAMMRSQSLVYRQAALSEPVASRPNSGTTASMISR